MIARVAPGRSELLSLPGFACASSGIQTRAASWHPSESGIQQVRISVIRLGTICCTWTYLGCMTASLDCIPEQPIQFHVDFHGQRFWFDSNRAVGGAKHSKHMEGTAFDIEISNHDQAVFDATAREAGFLGFSFYPPSDFIHIDLGPKREWGERFAPRPAFAPETPPTRERLAESRTIKGGGVAGVATVGAAGVEVAQEVMADTQDAVLPIVPYPDSLRWVFIRWRLLASRSRSTRGSTTGGEGGGDRRTRRRVSREGADKRCNVAH